MLTFFRDILAQNPFTFSVLRKIIERNFFRQKSILLENLPRANLKVLDIGCGTGEFSRCFQTKDYYGIDISKHYIDYAKSHSAGNFKVMDARELQFQNNTFDFVFIMAILHHLNDSDAQKVLKEALRVLKGNGKILILEDSKIPNLETFVVRFFQRFDKGDFIRAPEEYRKLISKNFRIEKEWEFPSGGCVYFGALCSKINLE